MNRQRPGILAVRAVNQYRRRDVLPFLALRYYLHNEAARPDFWAREISTDLVLTRTDLPYMAANHFNGIGDGAEVNHRVIHLPGANEALAEAALLDECGNHIDAFSNPSGVFSYQLSKGEDKSGIFAHYSSGLRARHDAIAVACDDSPGGVVRYCDIKRFYPSIRPDLALSGWSGLAEVSGMANHWRALGEKLISDHSKVVTDSEPSILTGPMFSHLIGNLVLLDLDRYCLKRLPAQYFRYVDDITLVGSKEAVVESLKMVRTRLGDLGLTIHDDESAKSLEVSVKNWLVGRNDYRESKRIISWMTLIGDLKRFLLANPEGHQHLHGAFQGEGFRIPVRDYSSAVYERSYLENLRNWAPARWFRRKLHAVSVDTLLQQALWLRDSYEVEFQELLNGFEMSSAYEKKRRIPKLRYRAGRLCYLAAEDRLWAMAKMAEAVPELHLQSVVMEATATGRIDSVLRLGGNAAQAAAQPMRAGGKRAVMTISDLDAVGEQSLSVFRLNGVEVNAVPGQSAAGSDFLEFAERGATPRLMKSANLFIREIACLHGISQKPRHPDMLESVFDEDEEFALDTVDQLQESLSP